MPIDTQRQIIFIHIPKTGGTSIEALLGMRKREHFYSPLPDESMVPGNKTPQHFTLMELQRNLSLEFFAAAFKFSFVRNPWDRFVSEFSWRQQYYLRWFRKRQLVFHRRDLESLDRFVRVLEMPPEDRIDTIRGFDGHLETQSSFLKSEDEAVRVDFIGRFEEFESGVRQIASRCGAQSSTVPHMNRSGRRDYRSYYSEYSRRAVELFYAEDIQRFNYEF